MLLQPTPRLPQVEVFRLPSFMVTMASNSPVILGRQRDTLMDQRLGGSTAPPRCVWSSARGVSVGFGIPDSISASGNAAPTPIP